MFTRGTVRPGILKCDVESEASFLQKKSHPRIAGCVMSLATINWCFREVFPRCTVASTIPTMLIDSPVTDVAAIVDLIRGLLWDFGIDSQQSWLMIEVCAPESK